MYFDVIFMCIRQKHILPLCASPFLTTCSTKFLHVLAQYTHITVCTSASWAVATLFPLRHSKGLYFCEYSLLIFTLARDMSFWTLLCCTRYYIFVEILVLFSYWTVYGSPSFWYRSYSSISTRSVLATSRAILDTSLIILIHKCKFEQ